MQDWKKLNRQIIDKLDIVEEYKQLGVEFSSRQPNHEGWQECHAKYREDQKASAAVNVGTGGPRGRFKDSGGDLHSLNFFDAAVLLGPYADFREARRHYAEVAGVGKRLPKKGELSTEKPWEEKLEFINWNPLSCLGLKKKLGIEPSTLRELGGRLCKYPAKSGTDQAICVAFPAYAKGLLNSDPVGYVIINSTGGPIKQWQGPKKEPEDRKTIIIGKSGLLGLRGLKIFETAELIIKTEGVSDMIKLNSIIPEDKRDKIAVVTNSAGCSEKFLVNDISEHYIGKNFAILHDCDKPGQEGTVHWCGVMTGIANDVRNVILPYEIEPKHGKDIRDWIEEGHTFEELMQIYDGSVNAYETRKEAPYLGNGNGKPAPEQSGLTKHQVLLMKLHAMVLGNIKGTEKVLIYSQDRGVTTRIDKLKHFDIHDMTVAMGELVDQNVASKDSEGMYSVEQVRQAIAVESSKMILTDHNQLGSGIWRVGDRLVIVGSGEAAIVNDDGTLDRFNVPKLEDKLLDFGSGEDWVDFDQLQGSLEAASPEWCRDVMNEAIGLFSEWDNWAVDDDPELAAALVCSSWIQTAWKWKPQVFVTGPSNSGKTTFLDKTIKEMFGPMALAGAKSTEAGIRQGLGNTSRVIFLDEMEHDKNRERVFELFRTSSRGGEILRGTADQKGMKFGLQHIPWMAAIETGLEKAADMNRFILLDLKRVDVKKGSELVEKDPSYLLSLGYKMMVVALRHWRAATALAVDLKGKSFGDCDRRLVESYSVPAAMLATILGLGFEDSVGLLAKMIDGRDLQEQNISDEGSLIGDIYDSHIYDGGKKYTVSRLLNAVRTGDTSIMNAETILEQHGVKRVSEKGSSVGGEAKHKVFFQPKQIRRTLLTGSPFKDLQIKQILARADKAKSDRQRICGERPQGVSIPEDVIAYLLSGGEDASYDEADNFEESESGF